jgi:hypothetical protein
MVPNPTLKLSFHAKKVIFLAEWNAWHIKMFLLYRGSQPNFLQNDFKEDYPHFIEIFCWSQDWHALFINANIQVKIIIETYEIFHFLQKTM